MIRPIILSFVLAICSTCLIRPWFWKGIRENDILCDDERLKIGFSELHFKRDVCVQIAFFIIFLFASLFAFFFLGARQNIYGISWIIACCLLCQNVWEYEGKAFRIVTLVLAAMFLFLNIQDEVAFAKTKIPISEMYELPIASISTDEPYTVKAFVTKEDIINLYNKIKKVNSPTYNNGKYIYEVEGSIGKGIVIIDSRNHSVAQFIPYEYDIDIEKLRKYYPFDNITKLYIAVSDENIPYKVFALSNKTWLLGHYEVSSYILANCVTGEIISYSENELPDFVTIDNIKEINY